MSRSRVGGLTALSLVAALLGFVVLHVGHLPQLARPSSAPPVPARSMERTQQAASPAAKTPGTATATVAQGRRTVSAIRVLREWDGRRAAAYAAGSTSRLAELYSPGSRAGAADVRVLRTYQSRGLRVTGMQTQLLAVVVLRAEPGRWVLRVEDRLARAVAVGDGRRRLLPRDDASTRTLTLLSPDGHWRVSSVFDR